MSRLPNPRPLEPGWSQARVAQLRRTVMKKMRKLRNSEEFRRMAAKEAAERADGAFSPVAGLSNGALR